jgi:hypothetical protein
MFFSWSTRRLIMQRGIVALSLAIAIGCISNVAVAATVVESSVTPPASKETKIEEILQAWQMVPSRQGTDVAAWKDMMRIQLRMASTDTVNKLYGMSAPADPQIAQQQYVGFIKALGADIAQRLKAKQAETNAARAAAGERVTEKALGDPTVDQTFIPITPCRVVDTRNVGGPYGNFSARNWFFYTTDPSWNWFVQQGGVFGAASTACPGTFFTTYTPSAAVATITVVQQGGRGNLIAWGGESPVASASAMSYNSTGDTSTLATVPWGGRTGTGPAGPVKDFAVFVNAPTATHVVVDIVGYYTEPQATALDCVSTFAQQLGVTAGSTFEFAIPSCPAGYALTGAGCQNTLFASSLIVFAVNGLHQADASAPVLARCSGSHEGGITTNINGSARCCRTPGR